MAHRGLGPFTGNPRNVALRITSRVLARDVVHLQRYTDTDIDLVIDIVIEAKYLAFVS